MAEAVEQTAIPSERSSGNGYSGDRVADVVIAVAEGALAVLPGLAPEDGGEGEEKERFAIGNGDMVRRHVSAELECVVFRRVVSEEGLGGERGERRTEDVCFSGVEVAAARVNAEGPGREAGGLPS